MENSKIMSNFNSASASASTIVFKISRYNESLNQLLLTERYNSSQDAVKSMGRVIFNDQNFISGLHLAVIDNQGVPTFSFDNEEDIYQNFNISLTEALVEQLQADIKDLPALAKPPLYENGVSALKGYQLHVEVTNASDVELISSSENNVTLKVAANQVIAVKIVTQADSSYLSTSEKVTMSLSMAVSAFAAPRKVEKIATPTTVEEAKAAIRGLTRAQKRGANRQKAKAKKSAANRELRAVESLDDSENNAATKAVAEDLGEELK